MQAYRWQIKWDYKKNYLHEAVSTITRNKLERNTIKRIRDTARHKEYEAEKLLGQRRMA
jgi:hypothetical protein